MTTARDAAPRALRMIGGAAVIALAIVLSDWLGTRDLPAIVVAAPALAAAAFVGRWLERYAVVPGLPTRIALIAGVFTVLLHFLPSDSGTPPGMALLAAPLLSMDAPRAWVGYLMIAIMCAGELGARLL